MAKNPKKRGSLLVNATARPTYLLVNDKPLRLPEINSPIVVAGDSLQVQPLAVWVPESDSPEAREARVTINLHEDQGQGHILLGLPRVEGTVYLVDPTVKIQFPYRDDFVVPRTYTMWTPPEYRKAMKSPSRKKRRKAMKQARKKFSHFERFPLIEVSRAALPITSPESPILALSRAKAPRPDPSRP